MEAPDPIPGIHHITAICGPAQTNVDFYAGVLGLRLVKQTVNFDDPGTYHLYYGDAQGTPGTIVTFFPWPRAVPGYAGAGMTHATTFRIPFDSLEYWEGRLSDAGYAAERATAFGREILRFNDPDGLALELAPGSTEGNPYVGVVPESFAIRSFESATLGVVDINSTAHLLTEVFGYEESGESDGRVRFRSPGDAHACNIDLVRTEKQGRMGAGAVHHVAFRAKDDAEQAEWQARIRDFGLFVTDVKDRQYFHSIYFREPGGVLFEIATDQPGFAVDEAVDALGEHLRLPPWLEEQRRRIVQLLPALEIPSRATS